MEVVEGLRKSKPGKVVETKIEPVLLLLDAWVSLRSEVAVGDRHFGQDAVKFHWIAERLLLSNGATKKRLELSLVHETAEKRRHSMR